MKSFIFNFYVEKTATVYCLTFSPGSPGSPGSPSLPGGPFINISRMEKKRIKFIDKMNYHYSLNMSGLKS